VAALAGAAILALLAVDVLHARDSLAAGDVRYAAGPGQRDLWRSHSILPFHAANRLLAIEDDLAYRRAVRLFRLSQPRTPSLARFELAPLRAKAEAALTTTAASEHEPARRSELVNMLGVLTVARAAGDGFASPEALRNSVTLFRRAIHLDPSDADAKTNLELVLRVRRDAQHAQRNARTRVHRAARAGLGNTGSGY
jgi:hypothetical protein